MNISLEDLKKLMNLAFDCGWFGYKETKEDCVAKLIEDYISESAHGYQNDLGITITTTKNNPDYYYYYACSNGIADQLDDNNFL